MVDFTRVFSTTDSDAQIDPASIKIQPPIGRKRQPPHGKNYLDSSLSHAALKSSTIAS
jgi:hypothetical protein